MKTGLACVVAGAVAAGACGADWPQWRGPNSNGVSDEAGWNAKAAKKLWLKELGDGFSSISVKDGRLFTMGNIDGKDIVYCLDAATGKEIWTHTYECEPGQYKGPRATPTIDGSVVYTVSRNGLVICFDAESGKVRWSTSVLDQTGNENIRWGTATSAVVEGDLLLLNIGHAGTALDKQTGAVAWKSDGAHSYASPVVFGHGGKRMVATFSAPGLQIVEVATGKKIADYAWTTKYDINGADSLVIGDKLFISSGYDHGCAMLDFASGQLKKVWESDVLKNQFSSSVHIDGYIYGVDGQTKKKGHLRCISAVDGAEQWSMPIGFGSLIAVDGKLVALGEEGTLYFAEANPKKYVEIHKLETGLDAPCWTPPVLANGIVYCRNDKGTLVALDARK